MGSTHLTCQKIIIKVNHGSVKFMYNRLYDGCHPRESVASEWVIIMKKAMSINDQRRVLSPRPMTISECYVGFPSGDSDTDSENESARKRRW
jgi:hypothetical protein